MSNHSTAAVAEAGGAFVEPAVFRDRGRVGMVTFLCSEVAFFATLVSMYLRYLHVHEPGPTTEILGKDAWLVVFNSFMLLPSSITIFFAERALYKQKNPGKCMRWIWVTMAMGTMFLLGTGLEWHNLMTGDGLYPWTNLFGTTFYTLIGFHALHVTMGVCAMGLASIGLWRKALTEKAPAVELISWYWHLVDGVWVVILLVVYIFGR